MCFLPNKFSVCRYSGKVFYKGFFVKINHSVDLPVIQLIFLWNRTFLESLDKLSFTAVNFIRSENNLALL